MVRVAVLVSGGGTNLQAPQDRGELGPARIVYVLSNRKAAYALERARAHGGIETDVLSKVMQPDPEKYDEALLQRLKAQRIDLIVLAGFLGIVGEKVLARYSGRILNIHPALIPSFCGKGFYGLHVHEAVLARGCKVTGATAYFADGDGRVGGIILQKAVEVLPDDDPETLQRRVMEEAEWKLLSQAVTLYCSGRLSVHGSRVVISEEKAKV